MPSSAPAYLPADTRLSAEAQAHYAQFLFAQAQARARPPPAPPSMSVPGHHAVDYDDATNSSHDWLSEAGEQEISDLEDFTAASVDGILNC